MRRKKAAEEMTQSLKNSMVESFNRISASMSGVMTGGMNSKARQSSYAVGRGTGAPASSGARRGKSWGGGLGLGGKGGNPPGRVNTTKGNKAFSANKAQHKKKRKRKQKEEKDKGTLPEETNTLPSLCRFFKKPERQKGVNRPSQRFRRSFMTRSWERGVCDLSVLHDIAEEDEDID